MPSGKSLSAAADGETAHRPPSCSNPASSAGANAPYPIPRCSAARHSSAGSPTGSAAAEQQQEPLVSTGSASSRRRKLSSIRPDNDGIGAQADRSRPPAEPARAARQLEQAPTGCRASRPRSARARARPAAPRITKRQELASVSVAQAFDHQLRQTPVSSSPGSRTANTSATGSADETARHESQHLRGGLIQPLGVVDHADERPLLRHLGEQAQHGQADEKAIRDVARSAAQSGRRARPAAGRGDARAVEQRRT